MSQPILTVTSHDAGKNAVVTVYPDRIERVKTKSALSISRAHQDTEVTPIRAVSSVQAKKSGFRTHVTVFASGNSIEFRLDHGDSQRFKDTVNPTHLRTSHSRPLQRTREVGPLDARLRSSAIGGRQLTASQVRRRQASLLWAPEHWRPRWPLTAD